MGVGIVFPEQLQQYGGILVSAWIFSRQQENRWVPVQYLHLGADLYFQPWWPKRQHLPHMSGSGV
ncbi:hypothetical protein E2C01_038241 [Portunus trituberculatus]|uniref:Uncharacterized protein n=1 Tax=Portunus trituberculatus TaxID=210409 RepID=A0A5B7FGA9_PORTR|nr:hypothetical protein [Portunus trituberculatus]